MVAPVKRNLQALVLLLTGAGMLQISLLTNLYLRYVQHGLRPLLIVSGVLLILLGFVGAVRDGLPFNRRRAAEERAHTHTHTHDHDHTHEHGTGPRIAWLLCVPALSLLLFAPPALGSYTASRDYAPLSSATADAGRYSRLPGTGTGTGAIALSVIEFSSRAVWDTGRSLEGRTVRLTGFVTPGDNGTWYLTRLIVWCCAADAQIVKVQVYGADSPPANAWVTITGTWHPIGRVGTVSASPALNAATVRRIPTPSDPYKDLPETTTG
jgi:uncharacterized repeat protein (TIGR03943 family)